MRKSYRYLAAWLVAGLCSVAAWGQTVTVSGTVRNSITKEGVPAVSVIVKGTDKGRAVADAPRLACLTHRTAPGNG